MAAQVERIKWVEDFPFMVDGFQFSGPHCQHYFLTHFHSDHYWGLRASFSHGVIYCSEVTALLIMNKLGVKPQFVRAMPLQSPIMVQGVEVTALDANHCPGAVMFLFRHPQREGVVLHTGDFRASAGLTQATQAWLSTRQLSVHTLYLDTTYCNPKYAFPPQEECLASLGQLAVSEARRDPSSVFYVGTYTIGKERAVKAVAQALGTKVYASESKARVLKLAGVWDDALFTSDKEEVAQGRCRVRMAWLGQLRVDRFKRAAPPPISASDASTSLQDDKHKEEEEEQGEEEEEEKEKKGAESDEEEQREEEAWVADRAQGGRARISVCGFRPTGWALTRNRTGRDGKTVYEPWVDGSGRARLYFVPYSEHSSFTELQAFVRAIRPRRLVPTVNVSDDGGRKAEAIRKLFLQHMDLTHDRARMHFHLAASHRHRADNGGERGQGEGQGEGQGHFDLSAVDLRQQQEILRQIAHMRGGATGVSPEVKGGCGDGGGVKAASEDGWSTPSECIGPGGQPIMPSSALPHTHKHKHKNGAKRGGEAKKRQRGERGQPADSDTGERKGKGEGPLTAYFKRREK